MAEQSRHAKKYTRSSHSTQEVTEVKLKSCLAHAMHDSRSRKGTVFVPKQEKKHTKAQIRHTLGTVQARFK